MIKNGGFEDGTTGWETPPLVRVGTSKAQIDQTVVPSGRKSFRVELKAAEISSARRFAPQMPVKLTVGKPPKDPRDSFGQMAQDLVKEFETNLAAERAAEGKDSLITMISNASKADAKAALEGK